MRRHLLSLSLIVGFILAISLGASFAILVPKLAESSRVDTLNVHRATILTDVYAHHGDFDRNNNVFHPGDSFFVHYAIQRKLTCIIELSFRLTMIRPGDKYTGLYSMGYPLAIYYGPPATLETNEYFVIPHDMPLGAYELRRINIVDCLGEKWVESTPPAALTIQ